MARKRYHDFRQEDSTELFNDRFRGMLLSGVYNGFNVATGGSGGLNLKFTHDTDPDKTGEVLGKLLTPDGVEIEEDADQDDVVVGSVSAGTPNIHFVVASYTYNAALPNNDVVYAVKQGVSGSPPTPPSLTDDEVLLATIDVPSGTTAYTDAGVDIKTAAKRDLYGGEPEVSRELVDVLKPGIYDALSVKKGSGDLDVTMLAGTWLSQENFQVLEAADQTDLLTLSDPGVGQYFYAWVIGAHKFEEIDPKPSPDYLLVEGTPVALTAAATIPDVAAIRTAVEAVDSKYDDDADGSAEDKYISKLALIRVQKDSGSVVTATYARGEAWLDNKTLTVYGGTEESEFRSGEYYGWDGLKRALERAAVLADLSLGQNQIPVQVDGEIIMSDEKVQVPSCVRLQGLGQKARLINNETGGTLAVEGLTVTWDTVNDTISNPNTTGPTTPPAGFVSRSFDVDAVNYPAINDLLTRLFCRGDRILLRDASGAVDYECFFVQATAVDVFEVFVESQYNSDGNPATLTFDILKTRADVIDIEVGRDISGDGRFIVDQAELCTFDRVTARDIEISDVQHCHFGLIKVDNLITMTQGSAALMQPNNNYFEHLIIDARVSLLSASIGNLFSGTHFDKIDYISPAALGLTLRFNDCTFGKVRAKGDTSTNIILQNAGNVAQSVHADGNVTISSNGSWQIDRAKTQDNGTLTIASAGPNIIGLADVGAIGTVVYSGAGDDPANRVMFSNNDEDLPQVAEHHNEDRNLRLMSDASITWTLSTGKLEWDDVLRFDIPWQNLGYTEIAVGDDTLSTDGDRLFVDIDRDASGVVVAGTTVRAKASAVSDRFEKDRVNIAIRFGDAIYMYDGTRIEDGQTVQLGATPPSDGSVTYQKLASAITGTGINTDPLAFMNKFLRDYIAPIDNTGWNDEFVFTNAGEVSFTYTAATGVVLYSGLTAGTLDAAEALINAGVPLWIMFRNTAYAGGAGALHKEEVISINSAASTVTVRRGLTVTVGSAGNWNGSIGRGAITVDNAILATLSYDADGTNPGRVTFSTGLDFSSNQVRSGYVFRDSAGNKFRIVDADGSGNGDWVRIQGGLRDVDTTSPTLSEHGAIYENNNPFDLSLADMRVLPDAEFIPIDAPGEIAPPQRRMQVSNFGDEFPSPKVNRQRRFTIPFDERVTVLAERGYPHLEDNGSLLGDPDSAGMNQFSYGNLGGSVYEITCVCTGVMLVTNGVGDSTPTPSGGVTIDGEHVGNEFVLDDNDLVNAYESLHNNYEPLIWDGNTHIRTLRLPQGIHTFQFYIHDEGSVDEHRGIKGFVILNDPPKNEGDDELITESPGCVVQKGGVRTFSDPSRTTLPSNAATWDKGGRTVRYVDKTGTRKWTSRFVNSFFDSGTASSASADISAVGTISQWRVGDILLIRTSAGDKFLSSILSIAASVITMRDTYPLTEAVTLHYYGKSYNTEFFTAGNFRSTAHLRQEEEIVQHLPTIMEFAGPGELEQSRVFHGRHNITNSNVRGVKLSDCQTGLLATGVSRWLEGGVVRLETVSDEFKIGFVGTGIALGGIFGSDTTYFVDEASCGSLRDFVNEHEWDDGIFIAGELPFGYHTVRIVVGASDDVTLQSMTIYGTKKPRIPAADLPGTELIDTHLYGDSETEHPDGVMNLVNGHRETQFGTTNYNANILRLEEASAGVFADLALSSTTLANFVRVLTPTGSATTINSIVYAWFLGKEFTFISSSIDNGGGGETGVQFLGNDGVWQESATMSDASGGFTVIGPTSLGATDATTGKRQRWTLSRGGFHCVRFVMSSNSNAHNFDSHEWKPRMQGYRTKTPIAMEHWMPWQHGGADVRNLSPFPHDKLVTAVPHRQTAMRLKTLSKTNVNSWMPFTFYSRGGPGRVTATFRFFDSVAALWDVGFYIDGQSQDTFWTFDKPVGDFISTTVSFAVNLPAGFHFINVFVNTTTGTFSRIMYTYDEDPHPSTRQLANKGLPAPTNGPGAEGEGLY